jgi:hypothetical protein
LDKFSRFMLLGLVLGFAIWRLVRYLKMGMAKRHPGLVSGAGMLVQSTAEPGRDGGSEGVTPAVRPIHPLGALGGFAVWLFCNVLVLVVLFGLPFFRDAPPLILMVAAVFPNFYLMPFARRLAEKWSA